MPSGIVLPVDPVTSAPYSMVFDANPLLSGTGIGKYVEQLIASLARVESRFVLEGHWFNPLGRGSSAGWPGQPAVRYFGSTLFPRRGVGLLRRFGVELPFATLTRKRSDFAFFTNYVSLPTPRATTNVLAVYDLSCFDCPEYLPDGLVGFFRRWLPRSADRADLVVTISEFTKSRIIDRLGVAADKIHITPIPPIPPRPTDADLFERFGLTPGYLLFVGTLEPRKNLCVLLDAYAQLPDGVQRSHPLVLAGATGWKNDDILRRVDELKNAGKPVIVTGYVSESEKSALYEGAGLYVQLSHYEGFGMPVLEAMSYAKPVLCSDIPVFREVAADSAAFVDKDDPSAVAHEIQRLLADDQACDALAAAGARRVAQFPSWDDVARDLGNRLVSIKVAGRH